MALVIANCMLVCTVHAVGGRAGGVQQLLERSAFALKALQLLQIWSWRHGHLPQKLHSVDMT